MEVYDEPMDYEEVQPILSDFEFDDNEPVCDLCGGEGMTEYNDCYELIEMEGIPLEENHLVTCPKCHGTGEFHP